MYGRLRLLKKLCFAKSERAGTEAARFHDRAAAEFEKRKDQGRLRVFVLRSTVLMTGYYLWCVDPGARAAPRARGARTAFYYVTAIYDRL